VEAAPDAALLRVEYADLLRDPPGVAGRVAAFADSGLDVAAMAGQVDPALHRQRSLL
jgi:hypothetical protein